MARLILYEHHGFNGRSYATEGHLQNLVNLGWNDILSSMKLVGGDWAFYEHVDFGGRCWVVGPGEYGTTEAAGIPNDLVSSVRFLRSTTASGPPRATIFEHAEFGGRSADLTGPSPDFVATNWNDTVSSIIIHSGEWEFFEHVGFGGRSWKLGPGSYRWIPDQGIPNDALSSMRPVGAPAPVAPVPEVQLPKATIYEHADFGGKHADITTPAANFLDLGWNDIVSSIVVHAGEWEFFEHVAYGGRSWKLGPGRYRWIPDQGIPNDAISSMRPTASLPPVPEVPVPPIVDEVRRHADGAVRKLGEIVAGFDHRVAGAVTTLEATVKDAAGKVDALVATAEKRVTDAAKAVDVATGERGVLGDVASRAPVLFGQRVLLVSYHGRRLSVGPTGALRPEAPPPVPAAPPAPGAPVVPPVPGAPAAPAAPGTTLPGLPPPPPTPMLNDLLPAGEGVRVVPRPAPPAAPAAPTAPMTLPPLAPVGVPAAPPLHVPSGAPTDSAPPLPGTLPFTILKADDPAAWAPLRYGDSVVLLAPIGGFLRAAGDGGVSAFGDGLAPVDRWVLLNPSDPDSRAVVPNHGLVALKAQDGRYLAEEPDAALHAAADRLGRTTRWTLEAVSPLGPLAPVVAGAARSAPAAAPSSAFASELARPGSALQALLDTPPSMQGDAEQALDGRRVPVVLAIVRDRKGATRSGVLVRLLHGKRFVDQARTNDGGLATLRYPAAAQDARGGLGLVEVPGPDEKRTRQVLFEVPAAAQHAVVEVLVDELPEPSGPPEDPFRRLPADFTPELYDDVLRLAGGTQDPILGPASGGKPGLGSSRTRIVKRMTLPQLGEKPARDLPPRRYLVNLRQEWVFLGYTIGQLSGVEDLSPGRTLQESLNTVERVATQTSESAQQAVQEVLSTVEEASKQMSSVDSLLDTAMSSVANSSVDASAETKTRTTAWAVGGFLGFFGGGAKGTSTSASARSSVRTSASLNTSTTSRSQQNASAQASSLMRSAQSTLNRQIQTASNALREVTTNLTRTVDQVSPLLSRTTNLLRWNVYENYAVVSRVEDVKEVAALRVLTASQLPDPVFRDEDIVEYGRFFAPALLDPSLLANFDALRRAVEAKRNASRPIRRVRVEVDFTAHVSSGELRVRVAGQDVRLRLRKGATRAEGVLDFASPVDPAALGAADLRLSIVGDYDKAPAAALPNVRNDWWFNHFLADVRRQLEEKAARDQEALSASARVAVTEVRFDYSTVMGTDLTQTERFGEGLVVGYGSERELRMPLKVPAPSVYTEYDPLFLHINRNKTYYLGLLLEAAFHDPALRDDCPQLRGFHGDHDIWRLPILGFEGDRVVLVRDVEAADAVARRLLTDPGTATIVQIAAPGAYSEALQGVLELADLHGKTPPQLERAIQLVPPGWQTLDALQSAKNGGAANGAPKAPATPAAPPLPAPPA